MQKSLLLLVWSLGALAALANIGFSINSFVYLHNPLSYWDLVVLSALPAGFIGALFTGIYQNRKPGETFFRAGALSYSAAFIGFIPGLLHFSIIWALAFNIVFGLLTGVMGMQETTKKSATEPST